MKTTFETTKGTVTFLVSLKIYSKEVIYKACYAFIEKAYLFLEPVEKDTAISVTIKGKEKLASKALENLAGEFNNELLNCLVRENVSRRNQKVLEQIVGGAMGSALGMNDLLAKQAQIQTLEEDDLEAAIKSLKEELEALDEQEAYEQDVLGIRALNTGNNKKAQSKKVKLQKNGKKKR